MIIRNLKSQIPTSHDPSFAFQAVALYISIATELG